MNNKPYAVVLGLESIAGLQTARILKRRGVPVLYVVKGFRAEGILN
jgi:hypothetical protein